MTWTEQQVEDHLATATQTCGDPECDLPEHQRRWTITREQLIDAIDGLIVTGTKVGGRNLVVSEDMADAILAQL